MRLVATTAKLPKTAPRFTEMTSWPLRREGSAEDAHVIGFIGWGRYKEADRTRSANPAGLWKVLEANAAAIADSFDFVQAPPDSLAQGGNGAGCDGYEVFVVPAKERHPLRNGAWQRQGRAPGRSRRAGCP